MKFFIKWKPTTKFKLIKLGLRRRSHNYPILNFYMLNFYKSYPPDLKLIFFLFRKTFYSDINFSNIKT